MECVIQRTARNLSSFSASQSFRWVRRGYQRSFVSLPSDLSKKRPCEAYHLGLIEYETAWKWQKQLIGDRIQRMKQCDNAVELPDAILILQHPSVYTLGRGASMTNVKFEPNSKQSPKLIRVDRGGEVTYHGPGQLVVYPILDLNHHRKDLHWYLRQVEEVVIAVLDNFGIKGQRQRGLTGVWVEDPRTKGLKKIAAIGTHATKWITMHGFAINMTTDLSAFDHIVPCGIENYGVINMANFDPEFQSHQVESAVISAIEDIFALQVTSLHKESPFA
uniref:lipoyl(octanoyl) transferase n=1 Tax=Albugo laibachii Nc14 TaxID=890382 RepID=F0WUK1_9STRA|nr:octanoyltransferase putative [Albugo laibachii Nc14]|eukprot:CCA25082.1 octanoyltransferase putative [Albugo laibachii Nc14]